MTALTDLTIAQLTSALTKKEASAVEVDGEPVGVRLLLDVALLED